MDNFLKEAELLRTKSKRAVIPIIGKALSVLFGTVIEGEINFVRRLDKVEGNQWILSLAAREIVSILNVTRLELAKNSDRINELISEMHLLSGEVVNISKALEMEFQELSGFIQQYFQLMIIANRVIQTGQSLIILLERVRAQLDMLSLGYLSPSAVRPG